MTTPASMTSVLRNSRAPKIIQPEPHGTAASISTPTRMRHLRQAEPQAGQDIRQRARQDHVVEQAPAVRAHGLGGAHPDFDRLHPGQVLRDDRKRRTQIRPSSTVVLFPSPNQSGTAACRRGPDWRADADQRKKDVLRPAQASHGQPDRHARHRGKRKPAARRMSVSSTWCGGIPWRSGGRERSRRRLPAAETALRGKMPRYAVNAQSTATTRNGKAVRATTRHRLSPAAAEAGAARTWRETVGARSAMTHDSAVAPSWTSRGCHRNKVCTREILPPYAASCRRITARPTCRAISATLQAISTPAIGRV